jgi:asparagine synthase (glutamine-hydrolysing)
MCGIAGYFGTKSINQERITKCLDLMHHRGPDHAAFRQWTNAEGYNIYMLHSRLSIIDLDPRANQPFSVNQKWISLNGELYNYLERREELLTQGCTFTTNSDTEVLLRAIDFYGWDVLDRCEGMWAFAVYDEKDGSLTLCRDRFGEKPLFLYHDNNGLYWGSEIKFIVELLGKHLEVNYDHLFRFMVNGYRALYKKKQTFYKELSELPMATMLQISANGKEREIPYWKLAFTPDDNMTYEEAVRGIRERMIRTVELRLRSDVPLAFCMSGGIDSNALICIAKREFNYDVHGFTIINKDSRYEENDMVECVVSELGLRHTPIPVDTTDFLNRLKDLVRQHDAPVSTISYYAHWLLMESIHAHGYRVSVSGTAGDELFSGYYDHYLMYLYETRHDPVIHTAAKKAWETYVKPLIRNPYLRDPELFFRNPAFRNHLYLNSSEFGKNLKVEWSEPFEEEHYTDNLLRNRTMNELFHEVIPVVLHEDDHNAMHFSIENRSPFLDRELVEFCHRIPVRHLIHDGMAKVILRNAMKGTVPDLVIDNRRKVGFNVPIFSFLDIKDQKVRDEILAESPIFDYVRREKIEELISKPDLENHESLFLFYFLNAKYFLEIQQEISCNT